MLKSEQPQEIVVGDTVTVLGGDRKGDTGEVTSVDRQQRSHYILYRHHVLFPDGSKEFFESIVTRPNRGDDKPREGATKKPKALNIEKVGPPKEKEPAAKAGPAPKPAEATKPKTPNE